MTIHASHAPAELVDEQVTEPPVSLSHFVHTLRAYKFVILLTLAAAAIAYALVAVFLVAIAPTERVTIQPFRLDFEGASSGRFPNGLQFSTADVVNSTILDRVYRQNALSRYTSFPSFSRSVFVLEANPEYERLAAEYQARLADARLTPVDRERVEREFQQKRGAIAKNEYSLNYVRREEIAIIPEPVVRKVLADVLNGWAQYAIRDQDVLAYRVAVLSPQFVAPSEYEQTDPMMAVFTLRSRIVRLLGNVTELEKLPGAELARGGANHMSLEEVRVRMEEIQRYEIEPLVTRVRSSGPLSALTLPFLRDQLDYDQRQLAAARRRAEAVRETLATYEQAAGSSVSAGTTSTATGGQSRRLEGGETIMPQLSDTFLDRIVDMASKSADAQYRQKIVNDYRDAMQAVIPLEQTVAYETSLLNDVKVTTSSDGRLDPAAVTAELDRVRRELKMLVAHMNDIYREVSHNVYSQGQLVTITAPPATRVVRAIDARRLATWGLAVVLLTLPLAVAGVVVHNRVREEEAEATQLAEPA